MSREKVAGPRARVHLRHERAVTFDAMRGIWIRQIVSDEVVWNLVTDAGRRRLHAYIYGTTRNTLGSGLNFIALSNDGTVPAQGDTILAGELTNGVAPGLGRSQATVTLPVGSGTTTTLANVFTFTGTGPQAIQKAALFDDPTAGVMAHEIQFTPRTLFPNDTITISYTIAIS